MEKRFPPSVRRVFVTPEIDSDGQSSWPGARTLADAPIMHPAVHSLCAGLYYYEEDLFYGKQETYITEI